MEEDIRQRDGLAMTTDRDRVEAVLREYYLDGWGEDGQNAAAWRANCRGAMSRALAAADALAPPPVPLDRDAVARVIAAHKCGVADGRNLPDDIWKQAVPLADAVLALLPAPPADTGDGRRWRVGRRVPVNVYRDDVVAAQFQQPEWAAEIANRVTLTRRVRELEQALRPFAIRMPPGRADADFYRPLEPFSRVGDHRRASALIGGSHE